VDVWWAIGNYYLSGCIAVDSIPCRTSLFRQYAPCLPPLVFSLNFVIPFLFYSAFFVCRLFSGRQRAAAGGSGSGGRLSGGGGRFGGGGGDGGGRGGHRRRSARRPAAARTGSGRAFRDGCAHVGDVGDMRVGERDVADQGARDAILLAQPPVLTARCASTCAVGGAVLCGVQVRVIILVATNLRAQAEFNSQVVHGVVAAPDASVYCR
jgi:hypothetical protein